MNLFGVHMKVHKVEKIKAMPFWGRIRKRWGGIRKCWGRIESAEVELESADVELESAAWSFGQRAVDVGRYVGKFNSRYDKNFDLAKIRTRVTPWRYVTCSTKVTFFPIELCNSIEYCAFQSLDKQTSNSEQIEVLLTGIFTHFKFQVSTQFCIEPCQIIQ